MHLNFMAVNWLSSQAWTVWAQLLESHWEASKKSSDIMKAQWDLWMLMTGGLTRLVNPLFLFLPLTLLTKLCFFERQTDWQQGDMSETKRIQIKQQALILIWVFVF